MGMGHGHSRSTATAISTVIAETALSMTTLLRRMSGIKCMNIGIITMN